MVRTLRNAVERDAVHHAYLFVGSRGTGKTSLAKILAACLNCERGRTVDPCGQCASCVSIAEARSLDVIEMDAASNNSVEDIRELRDSVAFAPLSGRTKVYILDEAHMLSTAAWNAFLKTLEEPPRNTVFVLATTEAQKVPPTVVDRCHRFDFQRPSIEQVATVLRRAVEAEALTVAQEAIAAIARAASGSFRDALGSLEQLITYSSGEITLADTLAVLGVSDFDLLQRTLRAVAAGDVKEIFNAIADCAGSGRDLVVLASDLEGRARDLIAVQVLQQVPPELSLTPDLDEALLSEASVLPQHSLIRLLDLLASATEAVKAGADTRTQLELALLKAARPELDPSIQALLTRVERLERTIGGAAQRGETARAAADRAADRGAQPEQAQQRDTAEAAEMGAQPEQAQQTDMAEAAEMGAQPEQAQQTDMAEAAEMGAQPEQAQQTDRTEQPQRGDLPQAHDRFALISDLWPGVIDLVRARNALLGAVIADGRPTGLAGDVLSISFPQSCSFSKKKAEDPSCKALVRDAIAELAGIHPTLRYQLSDAEEHGEEQEQDGVHATDQSSEDSHQEDLVKRIIAEFEAEELPPEDAPRPREHQRGG